MFKGIITKLAKHYFEWSLYLLTIALFYGNAMLSIAYVLFLIASCHKVFKYFSITRFVSSFKLLVPCLFFFVNLLVILFLCENFNEILKVEKLLPFLLFPIIFFSARETIKNTVVKHTFLNVFIIAAFLNLVISLSYGFYRVFFTELNVNIIYITYNHLTILFNVQPIYLSLFYLLAIIVSIDLYYKSNLKTFKSGYIIMGLGLFIGIILLSSRTSLALSIIMILVKLLKVTVFNKKSIALVISFFILGAILTFSIPVLKKRVVNFNEDISSYSGVSFRLKIWKNTLEVIKDSPIYGYGYKKSQKSLIDQYKKVNFRRAYIYDLNAHNQYLQTLLDTGIIGFVLLILMLFLPLLDFKRNTLTYSLFILIIIIALLPESFFSRQYGVIFFSLFSSFFCINQTTHKSLKDIC